MAAVKAERYVRKPLYVDAVQVTEKNFKDLSKWCQGEIRSDGTNEYIHVRVHTPKNARQTQAFVGDWLLYTDMGYKVYSNKAFQENFSPHDTKQDNHD
jgi:hypothetical protein